MAANFSLAANARCKPWRTPGPRIVHVVLKAVQTEPKKMGAGQVRDLFRALGHGGRHALAVSVEFGIRNHIALSRQQPRDPGDCDVLRVGL